MVRKDGMGWVVLFVRAGHVLFADRPRAKFGEGEIGREIFIGFFGGVGFGLTPFLGSKSRP